ncbi:hypothetical protein E2C01_029644 [Portunus trituberculatus]|uniref:Uncharacterized protein n=1 Tax=Portunus trituberculatus TaxID=210409 RepID=A0A5B7ES07_PORTR|nr:hypothetical protein [Portunus trituberculatus]
MKTCYGTEGVKRVKKKQFRYLPAVVSRFLPCVFISQQDGQDSKYLPSLA